MEIFVKNIKLINNSKAIVKSKWYNDVIQLNILVSDEENKGNWKIYKGECNVQHIKDQCDPVHIEFEMMKNYLTLETNTDGIMYDITGSKFIVFAKEYLGSDSEGYADIIYFKLSLDCEEISMDILLEQISDIKQLTFEIKSKNEKIKKDQDTFKRITETYEKLLIEKREFEKQFFNNAAALLNTKKLFIQKHITNKATNLNDTNEAGTSEDLTTANKKSQEKIYSSPLRTPSKRQSSTKVNTTPKRTPIKGLQRTPSKRLRDIQDMSDSDDSFTILSCDTNKKFSSKTVSDSLDSSRVFKNFKIKTPIKQKDNKRESSVELKIDRNTNEISPDESENEQKSLESKVSNQQNAQQMEGDEINKSPPLLNDTIIEDEEIPCSQEMEINVTSFSERMSLKSRNKSKRQKTENSASFNPYNVDTVNILNISD
ncbi:uncharacterized protein [Chironomus tepperi]|uniref:uncharacterized protein n=1 Tax=Chironomus tepperi TaxID=113505 RepID=UPI00391F1732